jgi:hypothetical protein
MRSSKLSKTCSIALYFLFSLLFLEAGFNLNLVGQNQTDAPNIHGD